MGPAEDDTLPRIFAYCQGSTSPDYHSWARLSKLAGAVSCQWSVVSSHVQETTNPSTPVDSRKSFSYCWLLGIMMRLARMFHELLAAITDMAVLPGVLGCSFDRLRTGSPCDVPFRYASEPTPCGCQVAQPSYSRSLRSAQSRKRVPSFVVSRQQLMKYPG